MKKRLIALLVASGLVFSGCGGGSDGGDTENKDAPQDTITGKFIDAPVKGLKYNCSSELRGETNQNGEYICKVGDDVSFYINTFLVGTVAAQTEPTTPYTLFLNNIDAAIRLARVLQTLDDKTIGGVINIDKAQEQLFPQSIDFSNASFETTVEVALGKPLIDEEEARSNMNSAITAIGGYVPSHSNSAPVANAGADQNVHTTNTVTLDGSNSSDADFDTLTYSWSITSKPQGSNATLSDTTVAKPTFVADIDGSYVIQLVVNDGEVNSAVDSVTVVAITETSSYVPHTHQGEWLYHGNVLHKYTSEYKESLGEVFLEESVSFAAVGDNGVSISTQCVNYAHYSGRDSYYFNFGSMVSGMDNQQVEFTFDNSHKNSVYGVVKNRWKSVMLKTSSLNGVTGLYYTSDDFTNDIIKYNTIEVKTLSYSSGYITDNIDLTYFKDILQKEPLCK